MKSYRKKYKNKKKKKQNKDKTKQNKTKIYQITNKIITFISISSFFSFISLSNPSFLFPPLQFRNTRDTRDGCQSAHRDEGLSHAGPCLNTQHLLVKHATATTRPFA